MGMITAIALLLLASWWFARSPKTGISWIGMSFFVLGLFPIAAITSFHPYMLLAIAQSIVAVPLLPLGIAVMGLGYYLAKSKIPRA